MMSAATNDLSSILGHAIAVVIVNYNTCRQLKSCLDSVMSQATSEVIVVDNHSSDGSVEMVKSEYPWVTLYANTSNVGYGAAANQAIAGCAAPYVLLLNSDTMLQPGALKALSRYLDQHPGAAIVGPRLQNTDGTLQASCYGFPGPFDTFLENSTSAVVVGRLIRRYVPGIRRFYWRTWPHDSVRVVPWLKGAALAIRTKAFHSVGGFDKAFFMYFEDADLCRRMKKAGWQVHFAPVTTVIHVGGASTDQVRADMAAQLLYSTNLFYRRHSPRLSRIVMGMIVKALMLVKWVSGTLRLTFTLDTNKRQIIMEDIAASKHVLLEKKGRAVAVDKPEGLASRSMEH